MRLGLVVAAAFFAAASLTMGAMLVVEAVRERSAPAPEPGHVSLSVADSSTVSSRLAEARVWAKAGDLSSLVVGLSSDSVAPELADAFAWDSLLAWGALQQATRVRRDNRKRLALLGLARDRAGRALAVGEPRGPSADHLRLLRVEACVAGPLRCDDRMVLMDLAFASESSVPETRRRAEEVLERWLPRARER